MLYIGVGVRKHALLYVGVGVWTMDIPLIHLKKGEFYPLSYLTKNKIKWIHFFKKAKQNFLMFVSFYFKRMFIMFVVTTFLFYSINMSQKLQVIYKNKEKKNVCFILFWENVYNVCCYNFLILFDKYEPKITSDLQK